MIDIGVVVVVLEREVEGWQPRISNTSVTERATVKYKFWFALGPVGTSPLRGPAAVRSSWLVRRPVLPA